MPDDGLYHHFSSTKLDNPAAVAAGKVPPSEWNHRHVVVGAPGAVLFNLGGEVGASDKLTFDPSSNLLSLRSGTLELWLQVMDGFGSVIQAVDTSDSVNLYPSPMIVLGSTLSLSGYTSAELYGGYGVDIRSDDNITLTSGASGLTTVLGPLVLWGRGSAAHITLADGNGSLQTQLSNGSALLEVRSPHATPGNYTLANSGMVFKDAAGVEIFRVWGTDPIGDSGASLSLYIGMEAGKNEPADPATSGYANTGVGYQVLLNNESGAWNTVVGAYAMGAGGADAYSNEAFGESALYSCTTGNYNSALGGEALLALTTGQENIALGAGALYFLTTGVYNTAVGSAAGTDFDPAVQRAPRGRGRPTPTPLVSDRASVLDTKTVFVGAYSGRDGSIPSATPLVNAIAIGFNTKVGASNTAVIGNLDVTDVYFGSTAGLAAIHAKHLVLDGALFAPVAPGGADTQVQYRKAGAFAGDAGLTYNDVTDTLTTGVLTATSKVALPNGTIAAPGLAFAADPAVGWYRNAANQWTFVSGGTEYVSVLGSIIRSAQSTIICWTPGQSTVAADTGLSRNAAGVVEVNNGTAGQFRDLRLRTLQGQVATTALYFDNPSNGNFLLQSGAGYPVMFGLGGVTVMSAATFSWSGTAGNASGVADTELKRSSAGVLEFNNASDRRLTLRLSIPSNSFDVAFDNVRRVMYGTTGPRMGADGFVYWANVNTSDGTLDTGLTRNAAGVVEINNGAPGQYRDLKLRTPLLAPTTLGALRDGALEYDGSALWFTIGSSRIQVVPVGGLLQPMFVAPLTTTLVPTVAGDSSFSFTRTTTAYVVDQDNVLRQAISGEVRFHGARRVRNILLSSDITVGQNGWTKDATATVTAGQADPLGGNTAVKIQNVVTNEGVFNAHGNISTNASVHSVWLKGAVGGEVVGIGYNPNTNVTLTTAWQRFASAITPASGYSVIRSVTTNATIFVWHPQQELVPGQPNQAPGDFVSVGVVGFFSPWHGAGVDGTKYFTTTNGNTVAGNVVTEVVGAAIPDATLRGFVAENSAINLCLQSQSFNTTWIKSNVTIIADSTAAPDGSVTADTFTDDATNGTHRAFSGTMTVAGGTVCTYSLYVKQGTLPWVQLYAVASADQWANFNLATGAVGNKSAGATATVQALANGWFRCSITYTHTAGSATVQIFSIGSDQNVGQPAYAGTGQTMYLWGAQLETGSAASSYIPTTSATVTRNGEGLTYKIAGNLVAAVGTAYCEVRPAANDAVWRSPIMEGSSGLGILSFNTGTLYSMGAAAVGTALLTGNKAIVAWDVGVTKACLNGGAVANGSYTPFISTANMAFGNVLNGTMRNVKIYASRLTDGQLQALTT